MNTSSWLVIFSPTILTVVVVVAGVVPPALGGFYAALAVLQLVFLVAAFVRLRIASPKALDERAPLPMWQKIILTVLGAYGLLLILVGFLTRQ